MRPLRWHLIWFAGIATVAFLIPLVGTTVLELQHDLYLLVYFTVILAALGAYLNRAGLDVWARLRRFWPLSLALGAVLAVFQVRTVLDRASTPHPKGAYFVFEIIWRGLAYGIVDVLVLSAFPMLVAYALTRGNLHGWGRKLAFGVGTVALSLVITATYHLGYPQFRSDDVTAPLAGNGIITLPAALTTNPLGSIVMHPTMHVAAVIHEYEGDRYLPPTTAGYEERFAGTAAWAIGIAWAALTTFIAVARRRTGARSVSPIAAAT